MTNHWIDIRNADRILIIGSNAAENHPMSFKYVQEAIDRGAKLISLDPRFTRTSSKAHLYAPFRSGTDIALMMGIINYVLNDIDANPGNAIERPVDVCIHLSSVYPFVKKSRLIRSKLKPSTFLISIYASEPWK